LTPQQAQDKSKQGLDLAKAGKYEEAGKVLEQVAQSDQAGVADAATYVALGITRYQKKEYPGALAAYDQAIKLNPTLPEPYQGKANIYRDQKNLKEAEVWYRKAWQASPQFVDAYTELALQLSLANRMPDAIAVLNEGVTRNPGNVTLQLNLASFYSQDGQKAAAKRIYEAILKVDPSNKDAKDALAALK
jgi:tetratricopeptide (TPR) repeat protein